MMTETTISNGMDFYIWAAVFVVSLAALIKGADWVIDLGPEGGDKGGEIVFAGPPEKLAACAQSYTGQYLKSYL